MLCRRYPNRGHPGVLIVTRKIEDVEDIARQINEIRGYDAAVARHGENKDVVAIDDLKKYPILVITHSAYLLALDPEGYSNDNWEKYSSWGTDKRKLIIIDEELDVLDIQRITLNQINALCAQRETWQPEKSNSSLEFCLLQSSKPPCGLCGIDDTDDLRTPK